MKAVRQRVQYAALRTVLAFLRFLPLTTARRFGAWFGELGYSPLGVRRQVVERQIAAAFPGLNTHDVGALARRAYGHLGRVTFETALLSRMGTADVLAMFDGEGDIALLRNIHARGHGVVACTGHVGSWELAAAFIAAHGLPIDVVARRMENPLFDGYLNRTRARLGMVVMYDQDAVKRVPRSLRDGRIIGLVADQGVKGLASTFVSFFGRPAKTPRGPAVFALRFGAPVVFCSALLQSDGRYRFVARELPTVSTGNRDADTDTIVQQFTSELERAVRRHPEQYFWHHKRWKRQPDDTPPELRDPVEQVAALHRPADPSDA